ncbi:protein SINE1-like [Oryza brachyantha]|uniref:TORTIFOLIA1/SINE1-2 N-terminal domain-containing protein n=1 Tax=Oryza brachyantha TaxID=4533 RepID=J3N967_ORYBR|nr:protein SINE1-like [Oryza brachyantha]XP_040384793.1 protein SINE1-like [Oryza brachyantha]
MGRSLSPLLRQELDNLDKDADSRRSAMKALKSYAKHLDSKSIPHFLAEVSDNKAAPGLPSGEFTISLYEVLARVHGRNIVPQIGNIMSTIMCTLSSSGGSFPLHQACSKVVPAIARYGIDPAAPDEEKAGIVASLCKPLCGALMGNQDGAASGAALCLKALVESTNWRFAAGETVNEVCLKVAGAMHDKSTQSNAHMALAMALVKHNGLIAEAYARSLVRSALQILDGDTAESSSQKRLSAIQMINFFMKFVDPRSISTELSKVVDVMEQCQNDRMPFVRGAAFEASQTAKGIAAQKGSRHEVSTSPMVGSNFQRRREKSPCRSLWNGKGSPANSRMAASPVQFQSPESHVVDSSIMCDSTITESPVSIGQSSCNFDQNRRANRRLWSNDGVDVSLKDGLFFRICSDGKYLEDDLDEVCDSEVTDTNFECTNSFTGFLSASPNGATSKDKTPSPQASERPISINDVKVYTTPRKLLRSLQSSYDFDSARNEEQSIVKLNSLSSPSGEYKEIDESSEEMQSQLSDSKIEEGNDENETIDAQSADDMALSNEGKSVLYTADAEDTSCKASSEGEHNEQDVCVTRSTGKTKKYKAILSFLLSMIMIFLAIVAVLIRIESYDDYVGLVPT